MSAPVTRVIVVGRDAALWLAAGVLQRALGPACVTVDAVELPGTLGPADIYAALPPIEALHNQLRIDEAALLRTTRGSFTLGQNFTDASGSGLPSFFHFHGGAGTQIAGKDFFGHWLKARRFGLEVALDEFSLTGAAAKQGRLMLPDDVTEGYARSDYGYHLPALGYVGSLKAIATHGGVAAHAATQLGVERDPESGDIAALLLDGDRRIEGEFFVDATGAEALLIGAALGVGRDGWRAQFPATRVLTAAGARFPVTPLYAEIRASASGWTGLHPSQLGTHLVHAFAGTSDDEAVEIATATARMPLSEVRVRSSDPGRRRVPWERNCVAIGEAACTFDPIHGVDLHAIQLGLIHLLAHFPAGADYAAQRAEYGRVMREAFERVRDFQSAHYALARYRGSFWDAARAGPVPEATAHRIALFAARGEIAPFEHDSFAPDSWRALFTGHGLVPDSWLPNVDMTSAEEMKANFRQMLGFVRDHVLRQPLHDEYLAGIGGQAHG